MKGIKDQIKLYYLQVDEPWKLKRKDFIWYSCLNRNEKYLR